MSGIAEGGGAEASASAGEFVPPHRIFDSGPVVAVERVKSEEVNCVLGKVVRSRAWAQTNELTTALMRPARRECFAVATFL